MHNNNYGLHKTPQFETWFNNQSKLDKWRILERFARIVEYSHLGDHKYVDDGVWELRWCNGRRVYYGYLKALDIVVVLGGGKNGQKRDIASAKKIFKEYKKAYG